MLSEQDGRIEGKHSLSTYRAPALPQASRGHYFILSSSSCVGRYLPHLTYQEIETKRG